MRFCVIAFKAFFSAIFFLFFLSPSNAAATRPNILLFVLDDVGIDQIDTFGYGGLVAGQSDNPQFNPPATPNIDAVANAGMRFGNAWTMPACSTSRGVLFTGRYPFRTTLYAALGPNDLANAMISPYEMTLPKLLKIGGYTSGLFGKFHLGLQGNNPYSYQMVRSLGWDYYSGWLDETGDPSSIDTTAGGVGATGQYPWGYVPGPLQGGASVGACYNSADKSCSIMSLSDPINPPGRMCRDGGGIFIPSQSSCRRSVSPNIDFNTLSAHYVSPLVIDNGTTIEQVPPTDKRARTYRNVVATDAAIDWIKQQQTSSSPWIATVSVATVHTPMQAPPAGLLPQGSLDTNGANPANPLTNFIMANQMIEELDRDIGRLLVSVGLATKKPDGSLAYSPDKTNTIVVIVDDNGSLGSVVRQPFDSGRAKGTAYQTGVWTPMIVAGPQVVPGSYVSAMVNIADLYQLFGDLAGVDVQKNVTRPLDARPMLPYLQNPDYPSIRKSNFTQVDLNLQANGALNGPCQFSGSCSHIPVTKSVCEDNGGVWFGAGATGTYPPSTSGAKSIPSSGFKYCCQVQIWLHDNGIATTKVNPTASMAIRNILGYKLVRNSGNDYNASSNQCYDNTSNELYVVNENTPVPRLDKSDLMIPTPYSMEQQKNYDSLTQELNSLLATQENCPGDGNRDGVVDNQDVKNYYIMSGLSKGLSSWYDLNADGLTNASDLAIINQNLGAACSPQH